MHRQCDDCEIHQILWWKIDAANEARAQAESRLRFVNDPVWSRQYPNQVPPCTIELVQESEGIQRQSPDATSSRRSSV